MWIGHRKEIRKLTFRALAFVGSNPFVGFAPTRLTLETSANNETVFETAKPNSEFSFVLEGITSLWTAKMSFLRLETKKQIILLKISRMCERKYNLTDLYCMLKKKVKWTRWI